MKFPRSFPILLLLFGFAAAHPAAANEIVGLRCDDLVPGREVQIRFNEDTADSTSSGFLSQDPGVVTSKDQDSPTVLSMKPERFRVLDSADSQGPHILGLTYFKFGATEDLADDTRNVFLTVERRVRGGKKTWSARVNLDNPVHGMIRGQKSDCTDTAE